MGWPACQAGGAAPYLQRRPQASPLYRVLANHFATLERVHEERFESPHGPLRAPACRAAPPVPRLWPARTRLCPRPVQHVSRRVPGGIPV
jgi:hypothetical protein